ncbi:MAG TPA: hypothetical protein VHW46_17355 [Terracidiphilus sp.]|jgi:hypothetical protein|nr:hypothetical protein [Terracidiphilus sp.]
MSEPDQQGSSNNPVQTGVQETFRAPIDPNSFPLDEGAGLQKSPKKTSGVLIVGLGLVAMIGIGVITLTQGKYLTPKTGSSSVPGDSDDMGAGIANGSGLRGHLVTRWQQGKAQYMLKMEPLDPRDAAGFAAVANNPAKPISINIRLLDSAGFALCGKEIVLHFDPTHASRVPAQLPHKRADAERILAEQQASVQRVSIQERARETGKDVFQNIQGNDGAVEALWSQGELPCSPDQYKKFDYWDLSTNFPTIAEQDAMLGRRPASPGIAAQGSTATSNTPGAKGRRKSAPKGPVSTYSVEGDDQISMYEASRSLLTDESGRSFFIPVKSDQTIAAAWASNYSHIHFKCDQQANCALRTNSGAILGRMSN